MIPWFYEWVVQKVDVFLAFSVSRPWHSELSDVLRSAGAHLELLCPLGEHCTH